MNLAVIPARGGSKRIPRKNILPFYGHPMIAWSIRAALDSNCFDRVIVSTDDVEIAAVARSYGAEAPFLRPAILSDDHVGTNAVMAHAVDWCDDDGLQPSAVCCIYATAPFIQPETIQAGLRLLESLDCSYVFSATSFAFPIARAFRITAEGRAEMFSPNHFHTRSQDLEEAYHDAGQFYWARAEAWTQQKPIFSPDSVPFLLPRYRVQDIDTYEDWRRAEIMFAALDDGRRPEFAHVTAP